MTENTTELQTIEIADEERQPCEVWTRVMGYFRPVASFNIGKQGEYNERLAFVEPGHDRDCRAPDPARD